MDLILDVGCGVRPRGDVNCDLFTGKTPHLHEETEEINPKTIPNFVRCDANHLPFKEKAFFISFCSHVLEHKGVNTLQVIKEMMRVTQRRVIFVVPHRFAFTKGKRNCEMHDKYFNVTNVLGLFKKLNVRGDTAVKYRYFPSTSIPLIRVPSEITAEIILPQHACMTKKDHRPLSRLERSSHLLTL